MIYCKNCGAGVRDGSKFCTNCGAPVTSSEAAAPLREPEYPQEPVYPQEPSYPQESAYPREPAYPQEQGYRPDADYAQDPPYQQQPYQSGGYRREPSRQRQMVYRQPDLQYERQVPFYGGVTIDGILRRALDILRTKPLLLWGLSLMHTLLTYLAKILCVIPIISYPIRFSLQVGMKAIYLDGIRRKEVNSDQLFAGFKNFFRSAGGIAWMELWLLIWSLVPIAGFVMKIIKSYSYRFVPYIMVEDSEISATAALRRSKELTYGMKGKMFLADLLMSGIVAAVYLILILLTYLFIKIHVFVFAALFMFVIFVFSLLVAALFPLFAGLVEAAFYDECPRK